MTNIDFYLQYFLYIRNNISDFFDGFTKFDWILFIISLLLIVRILHTFFNGLGFYGRVILLGTKLGFTLGYIWIMRHFRSWYNWLFGVKSEEEIITKSLQNELNHEMKMNHDTLSKSDGKLKPVNFNNHFSPETTLESEDSHSNPN